MPDQSHRTLLAVAGAHLLGEPLNPMLMALGADYVRATRTAPVYRLVALPPLPGRDGLPGVPARPGLIRCMTVAAAGSASGASGRASGASGKASGASGTAVDVAPGVAVDVAPGVAVDVEVYRMPVAALGQLMVTVAAPLAIGTVALADGGEVLGFVCEAYAAAQAPDISGYGGWRGYLASLATA